MNSGMSPGILQVFFAPYQKLNRHPAVEFLVGTQGLEPWTQ